MQTILLAAGQSGKSSHILGRTCRQGHISFLGAGGARTRNCPVTRRGAPGDLNHRAVDTTAIPQEM